MKKLSLYMLAFAGLFMTSCGLEDNEFAGLTAVSPDQAVVVPGLSVSPVDPIDLNTIAVSEALDVQVFNIAETALPEGVELSKGEILFADGTLIPTTFEGKVSGQVLSDYVASLFGREKEFRTVTGTAYLYAMMNGAATKINAGEVTLQVMPVAFPQFLYVPGNAQGWSPESAGAVESPYRDGKYSGYIYVNGGFKFTNARNWDEGDYGFDSFEQSAFEADGGNLAANGDAAGVYYVELSLVDMTLKATKINNFNLVGNFNGWNPADDTQQMTFNATDMCYEFTDATVAENGWKFTANNGWDINLGSYDETEPSTVIDNLVANGKNIGVAGTTIKLYPFRNTSEKIYCTVE